MFQQISSSELKAGCIVVKISAKTRNSTLEESRAFLLGIQLIRKDIWYGVRSVVQILLCQHQM